jgi:O-antigen/teichoic acid export membrane protein
LTVSLRWLRQRAHLVRNLAWLTGDRVVRAVVAFAVGILLIRYLGPEQFGLYSLLLAVVSLFSILSSVGTNQLLLRDFARASESGRQLLVSSALLRALGAVCGLALAMVAISIIRPGDSMALLAVVLAASGFFVLALDTVELAFQAHTRAGVIVRAKAMAFLLVSALKLVLMAQEAPLIAFFVVIAIEAALTTLSLLFVLRFYGCELLAGRWRLDLRLWGGLLRQGAPMLVAGGALMLQARADQVMLGVMLGEAAVGQYSAALRIVETLAFLPFALQITLAPAIARARAQDPREYERRILQAYRVMLTVFLLVAIPTMLSAPFLVELLLGSEYAEAGAILIVLTLRLFFTHQGLVRTLYITNEGLFTFAMLSALLGAVLNVLLNLLLIPSHGPIGAVWATLISFAASTLVLDTLYPPTRAHVRLLLKAAWPVRTRGGLGD